MAFAPPFSRVFPATFSRAAAAAAPAWYVVAGKTCVAAYDSVAASKAVSQINLASPGVFDMVEAGTVTWASGSWSGFSNANYFNTGVTPGNGYSMIVRFADGSGSTWREIAGSLGTGSTRFRLLPMGVADPSKRAYSYGGTTQYAGAAAFSGVMALTPGQGYYNGVADGASWAVSWSGTPVPVFIGTWNNNGTPSNAAWNGSIQAIAIYSATLTAGEVAAVSAAMAAL